MLGGEPEQLRDLLACDTGPRQRDDREVPHPPICRVVAEEHHRPVPDEDVTVVRLAPPQLIEGWHPWDLRGFGCLRHQQSIVEIELLMQ